MRLLLRLGGIAAAFLLFQPSIKANKDHAENPEDGDPTAGATVKREYWERFLSDADDTKSTKSSKKSSSSTKSTKKSSKGGAGDDEDLVLKVTNLAYQQPFSPFFVMVHSEDVLPLYTFGMPASDELAVLAEDGSAVPLVEKYENMAGVCKAEVFNTGAPYFAGENATIPVSIHGDCDYVTIATMAINTNDCFVAVNGVKIEEGDVHYLPGLDAGSEANDELCANIPGPACGNTTNNRSLAGAEGIVHVHRGFFGIGDLQPQSGYDWRNPMAQVIVM